MAHSLSAPGARGLTVAVRPIEWADSTKAATMRVLVCDDHALFREGLRLLLQRLDDSIDVSIAGSCEKGVQEAAHVPFDLVLMDWHMDGLSGADALLAFREVAPFARLVVLSGDRSAELVRNVVDLGAVGFIPKDASPELLMLALRTIAAGGAYLPEAVLSGHGRDGAGDALWKGQMPAPCDVRQAFPSLTERQADVLRSALRGLPNKLIARELGISDGTVKTHLSAIFRELDVQSRTEALYVAAKRGVKIS
jgi:two-component system nitrate/nitrite response regulator NarL